MEEKSGIQMIEEILQRVADLESQIKLIDNNIKKLLNASRPTVTEKIVAPKALSVPPVEKPEQKSGFKNFSFNQPNKESVENIMVKGKLKLGGSAAPLAGVSVTIFDTLDRVVKKTKTNRAGQWMSQLPAGQYVALFEGEINGKKLLPQNKNFSVPATLPAGQTEFEVI